MRTHVRKPIARLVAEKSEPASTSEAPPPVTRLGPVPGLTVGHADAPAELAADRLAETALTRLQRLGNRPISTSIAAAPRNSNALSRLPRTTSPGSAGIGRAGGPLDEVTGQLISSRLGRGSRLTQPSRSRMEAAFGTSLDHVRVHDDAAAATLNDAVSARAFTLGNDIFVGRDVSAANPGHDNVLAHEIAHVLTEPADVHRLHRYWELAEPAKKDEKAPTFDLNKPPFGQDPPVIWHEKLKSLDNTAYRYITPDGERWEASGGKNGKWIQVDWLTVEEQNQIDDARAAAAERMKKFVWWELDRSKNTVEKRKGDPGPGFREVREEERPPTIGSRRNVFVKVQYVKKTDSKPTSRDAGLRALDRVARLLNLSNETRITTSPHLATAIVNGELQVAGNSGSHHVRLDEKASADRALSQAIDPLVPLPPTENKKRRRDRKAMMKIRALLSGDYIAKHPEVAGILTELATALKNGYQWDNVAKDQERAPFAAEHGEMTLLAKLHAEFLVKPTPGEVIIKDLGGVKKACATCHLAYEAYNAYLAPKGYQIKYSGTHDGFYPGWIAPTIFAGQQKAIAHIKQGVENAPGNLFTFDEANLMVVLKRGAELKPNPNVEDPSESESEYEEA